MADITKCTNVLCPNAPHCYRVQAVSGEWQSVCFFKYEITDGKVACEHYWPMESVMQYITDLRISYELLG